MNSLFFLRALPWRYIAPALAVAGALWFAFDTGRDSMRAKLQSRIDLAIRERDAARSNVAALQEAIVARNAAIEVAAGKTRAAQDMAAGAVRKAQERDRALAGVRGKLADAARSVPGEPGCAVPDAVRVAWGVM